MKYHLKRNAGKIVGILFRTALIVGLCYLILKPVIQNILVGFMSPDDILDITVEKVPKNWSLYYWKIAWDGLDIFGTGVKTFVQTFINSIIQVIVCTCVGYSLARFDFKLKKVLTVAIFIVMLVPPQVYSVSQYLTFRDFYFFGNLINTPTPLYILSFFGLGLKQGVYFYLMKEFFAGLPKDLENAAYIDGASIFKTFTHVMVPNVLPVMATIFLLSFSWYWTDINFTENIFTGTNTIAQRLLSSHVATSRITASLDILGTAIAKRAGAIIILIPLIVLFAFFQKSLVQSITRSGFAN